MTPHAKGSALIVVLGLVAIIAGWASSAAYEDMLSLRRAENALDSNKAALSCLSALALAKQALKQDAKDSQTDDLDEMWAQPAPPFPVDDGLVSASIEDANRYINLNDLVNPQGQADPYTVTIIKHIFRQQQLNPNLVDALVDWVDVDAQPYGSGGGEDSNYFDKPYLVKNAPFDRWNELAMVMGFDTKIMQAIQPLLKVWPATANPSKININTVEAGVLQAMFPLMNNADMTTFFSNRPYADLTVLQSATWAQGAEAQVMLRRLSVVSDTFIVRTHAIFGHADRQEEYGLARQAQTLTWLWRERILWQANNSDTSKAGLP